MQRIGLAVILIVGVLAPHAVDAQQPGKVYRVGFLSPGDRLSLGWRADVLTEALRGHGWVEGKNLVIEYRFGGERYERLRALADDLVRLKVDLIFAASAPSAQAAKEATATLNDPVRAGLVASFAFPGGNMTGQGGLGPELDRKRIELLKEVMPALSQATVLANPSNAMTPQRLSEIEATAKALKVQLRLVTASDTKELDKALQAMARAHDRLRGSHVDRSGEAHRRFRGTAPHSHHLHVAGLGGARRPHGVLGQPARAARASGRIRRPHPSWRQARRPAHRATDQVRVGHQSQDRQGAESDDPAVSAA